MRLTEVLNRKDKKTGKEYTQFKIVLNRDLVKALDWKNGESLDCKIIPGTKKRLVITSQS